MISPRGLVAASKRGIKRALTPLVRTLGVPVTRGLPPATWGLTHEPGRGLCLEGVSLHELLGEWGSPLHVVHAAALERNLAAFQRPGPGGHACEVYYSCKTNPVPGVLLQIKALGGGIEVISPYELWLARELGFAPGKIIYNGPAKSEESIRSAIEDGILAINANHREEIALIARLAREAGRRPTVGVRVTPQRGWAGQFGIPIATGEALAAFEEAVSHDSLRVASLHAHLGRLMHSADDLAGFVAEILAFCDEVRARLGVEFEILDFGGSLGIPTVRALDPRDQLLNRAFQRPLPTPDPRSAFAIEAYASRLVAEVEAHYRALGRPVPRIVVEPGRALTGNTQMLVASVIIGKESSSGPSFLVLDAGINVAEGVLSEYHQLFPVNRYGEPATRTYALAGPICTPADITYPAAELPALQPGDSVAIMDAGAYFVPFATSFSFPQPGIVMVRDGEVVPLRRAETFEDLIDRDAAGRGAAAASSGGATRGA